MRNHKEIEITEEDLKLIHGVDYEFFREKIIPNCNCTKCNSHYQSTIVNYKIFLNDIDDIILKGFCEKCGNPVNRYLETGDVEKYRDAIKKVKRRYLLN